MSRHLAARLALATVLLLPSACSTPEDDAAPVPVPSTSGGSTQAPSAASGPIAAATVPSVSPGHRSAEPEQRWSPRPAWLGTQPLPLRPDGFGEVQPTPDELRDRRLASPEVLPPPPDGNFRATIEAVPAHVAERSTWSEDCPVALDGLRYVTVTFWGFDERPHTGELLVNGDVAREVTTVFRELFDARFPIERMSIVSPVQLEAPPTGDGNNTTAFVCRPTRGSTSWSEHAYGLAIDVNPFHNPYVQDDLVLPELASAYTDRSWRRPGMIHETGVVTAAFERIGWEWGGDWERPTDWMHFSRDGR